MSAVFILYFALFLAISIGVPTHAERYSRHVITRKGRDASGQDVSIIETVTKERIGGGDPVVKEEEAKTELSDQQKRFLYKREVPRKVGCPSMKPPYNGFILCSQQTGLVPVTKKLCKATCIRNYKFPDGSTVKVFNCTLQGEFWNKIDQPPDCQPAKPGIGCNKDIQGKNQAQTCFTYSAIKECKSECNSGHKFPNGETELRLKCIKSTGIYEPIDKFPDCVVDGDKFEEEKKYE